MTNKTILREIHRENKSINRNLQRLANIGLIGLLGKSAEAAKKTGKDWINISGSVRDSTYDSGYY